MPPAAPTRETTAADAHASAPAAAPTRPASPRIPRPDEPPPALAVGSVADRLHRLLAAHADPNGHVAAASADLAALLGVSTRTVRIARGRLEADGHVELVRVGVARRPAEYRVLTQARGVVPRVPRQRGVT